MSVKTQKVFNLLKKDIKNNNATYKNGFLHYLKQCINGARFSGTEIEIKSLPSNVKTLGDVKAYYGLPDGCLKNNVIQGGGDLDTYKAIVPITILTKELAKGLGIEEEEIKKLFE